MCYKFNEIILGQLKDAFKNAAVKPEPEVIGFDQVKKYLLIEFSQPIQWIIDEYPLNEAVDNILAGDENLSILFYHRKPQSVLNIEATLSWRGDSQNPSHIIITGLLIKLTAQRNCLTEQTNLGNALGHVLLDAHLIHEDTLEELSLQLQAGTTHTNNSARPSKFPNYGWFCKNNNRASIRKQEIRLTQQAREYISRNIPLVTKANKVYKNEGAINPAFEKLQAIQKPLLFNEKRIWVLRDDFQLIFGVKNAYDFCGYRALQEILQLKNEDPIDINDRFGHPSLVQADKDYQGDAVYYAGHIAQRDGYIEVLNYSGRFTRTDISAPQVRVLEAYIAWQFQKVFGEQPVIFVINARNTYADYFELSLYYADKPLPKNIDRRIYTAGAASDILLNLEPAYSDGYGR